MVGTRWESSKRPLFVRTVWKDGHHHVVLQKDEECSARTARSSRRNPSSSRKKPPTPADPSPFKVPSVKLLLASLRNLKNDATKKSKPETRQSVKSAITVIPSDSLRSNDLNKQVCFSGEKRAKFTTKSSSVDVHETSVATPPPPFSYDNYCVDRTSLSERVMIWLDLAVQNQKQFKNVDLKKRVVTAQACPIVERSHRNPEQSRPKEEETKVEGGNDDAIGPLVTSRMECDRLDEVSVNEEAKMKVRSSTAKRQLHIFLPLPKKCSESGSCVGGRVKTDQ